MTLERNVSKKHLEEDLHESGLLKILKRGVSASPHLEKHACKGMQEEGG